MDIDNKLNFVLTYKLYIYFLLRKQFILPVYIILTVILLLACIANISPLFADSVFTLSNIYLVVIFFSDNEKSFNHFRRVFNINPFCRIFIKLSLIYIFFITQIIIILFSDLKTPTKVISFYTFFVSSLLCLFILSYEIKNILFKILSVWTSALILFILYFSIADYYICLPIFLALILSTTLYTVIKLKYEANHFI